MAYQYRHKWTIGFNSGGQCEHPLCSHLKLHAYWLTSELCPFQSALGHMQVYGIFFIGT